MNELDDRMAGSKVKFKAMEPPPDGTNGPRFKSSSVRSFITKSYGILFVLFLVTPASCDLCNLPGTQTIYSLLETDPEGTVIFSLPAPPGVTWRYDVGDNANANVLRSYLRFSQIGDAYQMSLAKPLDLEELWNEHRISDTGFVLVLTCSQPSVSDSQYEILLSSQAVSEYAPAFNTSSINVYVAETPDVVTVVNLEKWASDRDQNPVSSEIASFDFLQPANPQLIMLASGRVSTVSGLDYESLPAGQKYLTVGVLVRDSSGKTGTASLTVHVVDVDDLPPVFVHTGCLPSSCSTSPVSYSVKVYANSTGKLTGIQPAAVRAQDGDALQAYITYTIVQGPSGYQNYVSMDYSTGEVTILKALFGMQTSQLVLLIQAREETKLRRHTRTSLLLSVVDTDPGTIPALPSKGSTTNNLVLVGAVLGSVILIILIVLLIAMIYYRKRARKAVHPEANVTPRSGSGESDKDQQDVHSHKATSALQAKSLHLSDTHLKMEEEITTWDTVDLSDEDTLKKRKHKPMKAPSSTKMTSRDSAFEEGSDKKSGSEYSHRDPDPDFDPLTEYAEVGIPVESSTDRTGTIQDHNVYAADPTKSNRHTATKSSTTAATTSTATAATTNTNDSGVDEAEYLSPGSARSKVREHRLSTAFGTPRLDLESPSFSDFTPVGDNNNSQPTAAVDSKKVVPGGLNLQTHAATLEKTKSYSHSPSSTNLDSVRSVPNPDHSSSSDEEDEDEMTEYSTPKSAISNTPRYTNASQRSVTTIGTVQSSRHSHDPAGHDDDDDDAEEDNRPQVPPRPKTRQTTVLKIDSKSKTSIMDIEKDGENHYATVQKKTSKKSSKEKKEKKDKKDRTLSTHSQTLIEDSKATIDPPMRKKRHRKRSKVVNSADEDVYDGTKDYEDLEMDPEFYLDKNKSRVRRSSRVPVAMPDPNDTQYWITVRSEY